MIVEITLFFVIIFLWKFLVPVSRTEKLYRKIPGPKAYPLIGNILEFYFPKTDIPETLNKLSFEYGPVCLVRLGGENFVCLRDPGDVESVLSDSTIVHKAPLYDLIKPLMGDALFTCSGEKWPKQRKTITPTFSLPVLKTFVPIFAKNADIFVNNLLKTDGKDVDVSPLAARCSLDIICETAMGLQVNSQLSQSTYLDNVEELSKIISHRGTTLIERTFLFPYLKVGKRHDELANYYHETSERIVHERKQNLLNSTDKSPISTDDEDISFKRKKPFLDLLLEINKETENGMTDLDLRMQVDTFMIAGYDTIQSSLSFALYSISQDQDVQTKVLEEMDRIFGDSKRDANFQDLQEMTYLENVLKETMRMYPPAQFLARMTFEDLKIKSGYIIPKNSSIMILIEAMNKDPQLHHEPLKFNPDRFNSMKFNPYSFLPFGAGVRNCIGKKFAMLELKSVLSKVIRSVRLLPSDIAIVPFYELVIHSKTGVHVRVLPRQ